MNIVWDSAEQGICYQGCAFTYCNPLHVGIAIGCLLFTLWVVYFFLNQVQQAGEP